MISSYLLSSTLVPVLCVLSAQTQGRASKKQGKGLRPHAQRLWQGRETLRASASLGGARCIWPSRGLILWQIGGRLGTELFPPNRFGRVRASFSPAARLEFRDHPRDGAASASRDPQEAKAENVEITHRLRRPGRSELRHEQHRAVHARPGRWLAARRSPGGQGTRSMNSASSCASPARADNSLVGGASGAGGIVPGRKRSASHNFDLRFSAGRHRHQGDELRLDDADLGPRCRHRSGSDPVTRTKNSQRDEANSLPARRPVPADAGISHRARSTIDREKAGLSGIERTRSRQPVIVATSSSRFIALNYWHNPKTGFDYQVEVLVPPKYMKRRPSWWNCRSRR